ncbi:MAG: InlB B-repeat-containing protein, partial [Oscillospiraceae bacterium]|nr:InlB B-repeat-containing protein [Oscillospiraceae bacterium]
MNKKRFFAILLTVLMLFQALPFGAMAEGLQDLTPAAAVEETAAPRELTSVTSNVIGGDSYGEVSFTYTDAAGKVVSLGASTAIAAGQPIGALPEAPVLEGYVFVGWVDQNGAPVTADTIVTSDLAVRAVYEVDMPYQSFYGNANGLYVTVSAPAGRFPAGTKMVVTGVSAASVEDAVAEAVEGDISKIKAVDISFYDAEGNNIQPADDVKVKITAGTKSGLDKANDLSIVHVSVAGEAEVVAQMAENKASATFATSDFSVYVVVESGENARIKVVFHQADGTEVPIYVKQADTTDADMYATVLYDPGPGEMGQGVQFRGWTTDHPHTDDSVLQTISQIRTDVAGLFSDTLVDADQPGGTILHYYAGTYKVIRIFYQAPGEANETPVVMDAVTEFTTQDSISHKVYGDYTPGENENFDGWFITSNNTAKDANGNVVADGTVVPNQTVLTLSADTTFKVSAPKGHWLIFHENAKGASYTPPQFLQTNDTTTEPDDPVRAGYDFSGWFTDAACTQAFTFGGTITAKTELYAKWTVKSSVDYIVIIWKQNVAGDGYDFEESIPLSGTPNTNVDTVSQQGTGNNANNAYARINGRNYQYTGFHLDRFDQNVNIVPEGGTVVNVYYNRNEYTLTFQDHPYTVTTSGSGTQYALIDGQYVQLTRYGNNNYWYNGQRYYGTRYTQGSGWTTVKEIKALYQQNISANFPIVGTNGATYNHGERWDPQSSTPYSEVLIYIDVMPSADVTFHLDVADRTTKTIHYYVEALPNETPTRTYNGKGFTEYKSVDAQYRFFTEAEDYVDLVGFTKGGTAYPPEAYNANGTKLNSVWNNDSARHVYCYYTRNVYPINFMDGVYVDGSSAIGSPITDQANQGQIGTAENIVYGSDVSSYNNYTPDAAHTPAGFVFEGWYIDDACSQEYTFDKMPEGGITVYAKWRIVQYRVFLHPNAPAGANADFLGGQSTSFRVDYNDSITKPKGYVEGYELVGWYLKYNDG